MNQASVRFVLEPKLPLLSVAHAAGPCELHRAPLLEAFPPSERGGSRSNSCLFVNTLCGCLVTKIRVSHGLSVLGRKKTSCFHSRV